MDEKSKALPDLISYHDIKDKLKEEGIEVDPELFLMLIQKDSLAPYSWQDQPLARPDRRPKEYIDGLKRERKKLHHKKVQALTSPPDGLEVDFAALVDPDALVSEHKIDERIRQIDAEIKKYGHAGIGTYDWTNYRPPPGKDAREALWTLIGGSYYDKSAIDHIKKSLPMLREEELSGQIRIDRSNRKNKTNAQRDREAVRQIAPTIWENGPITIRQLSEHETIIKTCEGRKYTEKTIQKWVHDINPYSQPGRPKKIKKPEN